MWDKQYNYKYVESHSGRERFGSTMHDNDSEAVRYYKDLELNGGIKMLSLKRDALEIWNYSKFLRLSL